MDLFDLAAKISLDRSEYDSGLNSIQSGFSALGTNIANGFKTAFAVGAKAIGAATTAIVGFGTSAVKTGLSFDEAMSQVGATMGLTAEEIREGSEEFDKLREKALEMGSSTMYTATEAAEGLNILKMSGFETNEALGMIEDVLHLAAAGSMSLAEAADYVGGSMKGFNDSTKDAQYYADLMAKGATLANTSVTELGQAMADGSATAANYGQSAESMTVALLRLAEQGDTGSAASTALAAAMKNLFTPTDQAKQVLTDLGVNAYDPTTHKARDFNDIINELSGALSNYSEEQKNAYLDTIFGIQGFDAYNKLTVTSIEKQKEWTEALASASDGMGAAATQYGTMTDNLQGDLDAWGSAVEGFKIAISDNLTPTIRDFVQFGTEGVQKVTKAFQDGGIDGAMAAFGDVLSQGITMITSDLPRMVEAGAQLLGALVQGLLDNLPTIVDAAIEIAGTIGEKVIESAPKIIEAGLTIVSTLKETLENNMDTIIPAAVELIVTIAEGLLEYRVMLFEAAVEVIVAIANYLVEALPDMIDSIVAIVEKVVTVIMDNLPLLLDASIRIISTLAMYLVEHLPDMIDSIISIVENIVNVLLDNIDMLINAALQLILALTMGLIDALPKLQEKVPEIITTIVEVLIRNLPQILMAALQIIIALGEGLIKSIPTLLLQIPEIIKAVVDGIIAGVEDFKDTGVQLIEGLWEGIKERWSKLVDSVMNLGGNLITKVRNLFGIESPSKVFRQIGEYCVEGLDEGSEGLFGDDGLTASVQAEVETRNSASNERANYIIELLEEYLPGLATKDSFNNVGISVNKREFGRLVSEVG